MNIEDLPEWGELLKAHAEYCVAKRRVDLLWPAYDADYGAYLLDVYRTEYVPSSPGAAQYAEADDATRAAVLRVEELRDAITARVEDWIADQLDEREAAS